MSHFTEMLVCWKCGAEIQGEPLPLARSAACKQCSADLLVCKMCLYYDTGKAKSCAEPIAEEVRDKERANFCDYFSLKSGAHNTTQQKQQQDARQQLEALFGNKGEPESKPPQNPRDALEALFKKKD
ncbi:MAG: hypothetical protein OEZ68_10045 [Gammaproteobacteria bacterium]|nr:hypothetical protein [Gammaproteobacteria bacterium]MDH5801130.1 hypothetical protein [Gammaproteobacteria bacterium]